jgi:hypothetical protein
MSRNFTAVANALPGMLNMAWFISIIFFYTYLFSLSCCLAMGVLLTGSLKGGWGRPQKIETAEGTEK